MDRLAQLLAFRDEDPEDSFVRFALASEYIKLGRDSDARVEFERLVADDPAYVGTYYHLGKLYERLEEVSHAREIYRAGIEEASRQSDLHARAELQSALLELDGFGYD